MSEDEFQATKAAIAAHADYWRDRLGLKGWTLIDHYYRDVGEFLIDNDNIRSAATVKAVWPYMTANFYWNVFDMLKDDNLDETVLHEHAHVLVCEMRDPETKAVTDHEERVVTMVTNALVWTRDHERSKAAHFSLESWSLQPVEH